MPFGGQPARKLRRHAAPQQQGVVGKRQSELVAVAERPRQGGQQRVRPDRLLRPRRRLPLRKPEEPRSKKVGLFIISSILGGYC